METDQSKQVKFAYDISIEFTYDNINVIIAKENIQTIVINREFTSKNMPTIYATILVNTELYNAIASNQETATFLLKILKYDYSVSAISKNKYIQDQFVYISKIEPYAQGNEDDNTEIKKDDLHRVTVGLYKKDIVNNNKKKLINNIFKGNNMISIIHYYTSHMKMVIEPFDNNRTLPVLIIPPIDSISSLLKFLNKTCGFYNTPYVYFMDLDRTYLISTKGNILDTKDGDFNTFKLTVTDNNSSDASDGMNINSTKKIYSLNINSKSDIEINLNKSTDTKMNVLSGVSVDGFTSTKQIKVNKHKESGTKEKYIRLYNDNITYINQVKADAELSAVSLIITKTDIDTSLFTPNKEYNVINKALNKNIDGKYFLSLKKEIYVLEDGKFKATMIIGLQKTTG